MNNDTQALDRAKQSLSNSQNQIQFYQEWFDELLKELEGTQRRDFKRVVEDLLFWHNAKNQWEKSIERWSIRLAVYPPPNGEQ